MLDVLEHETLIVPELRSVTLTKDGETVSIIDLSSWALVAPYRWSLHYCGKKKHYARAERCWQTGEKVRIYMHRLIAIQMIGEPPRKGMVVDHLNGNGLDNRVENLRWADKWANRWRWQQ